MSGRPKAQKQVLAHRGETARDGEPLKTVTRGVSEKGGSLDHTIPSLAVDVLGLEVGEEVKIDIYKHGYIVSFPEEYGDE